MKIYPIGIRVSSAKLQKSFRTNVCCPTPKHVTNTIIQKFPLPRVLLHGQTDTTEAEDRCFFKKVVDKSICDAISGHNEAFVNVFHNAMKEAIHGFLVGQGGLAYYNIPDPLIQGTNLVGTSHQEATPAGSGDVQIVQGSSE